jgi:hypothetical protein
MDATTSGQPMPDPLDNPLYRIAHLHDSRWVTVKPEDQHSPKADQLGDDWAGGSVYKCEECEEYVVIAPQ